LYRHIYKGIRFDVHKKRNYCLNFLSFILIRNYENKMLMAGSSPCCSTILQIKKLRITVRPYILPAIKCANQPCRSIFIRYNTINIGNVHSFQSLRKPPYEEMGRFFSVEISSEGGINPQGRLRRVDWKREAPFFT
jgi:hypothetical protein